MCITELDVGGAEKAFVRIAIGLQNRGWIVRVISLRDAGPLSEPLRDAGIKVTALNCRGFMDVRCYWRLKRELRTQHPDLILCFLHQANFYGRLAGRAVGIRNAVSGIRVADRRLWIILTDRMTRCCTSHYVAVSRSVAQTHASLCAISDKNISDIPNGIDIPESIDADHSSESGNNLLFVGRLCPQKHPENLVAAYLRLPEEIRKVTTLNFVGDGELRPQLEALIDHHQLADHIRLLGHRNDVATLMRRSKLLILPSRWEGLPNVVLEAMANDLPVVATSVDGVNDVVDDGSTGWLVPPEDADSLAKAIQSALESPAECRSRSKQAKAFVAENFSWESVVEQYDRLLRTLNQDES